MSHASVLYTFFPCMYMYNQFCVVATYILLSICCHLFLQSSWSGTNLFGSDPFSGSGGGASGGRGGGQSVTTPTDPFTSDPFMEDPFGSKGTGSGSDANPFGNDTSDAFGSKGWANSKVNIYVCCMYECVTIKSRIMILSKTLKV